jgi:hypothetical protein
MSKPPDTIGVLTMLEEGSRVLSQAKAVQDKARSIGDATRDLILRFRSHCFRPMSGASDQEIPTPSYVWVGPCRGATCEVCDRQIVNGETEFVIVARGREMRLDRDCFQRRVKALL